MKIGCRNGETTRAARTQPGGGGYLAELQDERILTPFYGAIGSHLRLRAGRRRPQHPRVRSAAGWLKLVLRK